MSSQVYHPYRFPCCLLGKTGVSSLVGLACNNLTEASDTVSDCKDYYSQLLFIFNRISSCLQISANDMNATIPTSTSCQGSAEKSKNQYAYLPTRSLPMYAQSVYISWMKVSPVVCAQIGFMLISHFNIMPLE